MNLYLDKIFFIKSKRIVLPNPLVKALTAPATRNNNVFTFLYLGQVEEYKGVNLLIQAFKKVKEKYDRAELVIAGTGANLENLKNIAGEDKSVKFLGWPGDEIADKLLLSSDCLIYPSLVYENCPHAIQKAFGAGLPVIAADLGGISELVSEDGGILFRPGNPVDLVEKMLWAIDHKSELAEIAKAGLVKAASYNVENYIKELQSLINQ
jgi:glycosyltransferase involved in cell wall biosynthesis